MVQVDGEKGNDHLETIKSASTSGPFNISEGAPRAAHELPEICINHMQRLTQTEATKCIERPFTASQLRVTREE